VLIEMRVDGTQYGSSYFYTSSPHTLFCGAVFVNTVTGDSSAVLPEGGVLAE